jgi:[acyl-carrier-protein] S-malonyltransferase
MFEGQGSIVSFMGKNEYKKNKLYKKYFDYYNSLLDFSIESIIWGRKKEYKTNTLYAHMILYVTSLALYRVLDEYKMRPSIVLGHSLGELIATIASGAISEKDGARLIQKRGMLFEKAKLKESSDMLVLVGDRDKLNLFISTLQKRDNILTYKANYNSPNQMVISIYKKDQEEIIIKGRKEKIKIVKLNIGIGCHSPFLNSVDDEFCNFLDELEIVKPKIKLYSTSFNKELIEIKDIRSTLKKHLLSSVYWDDSIQTLIQKGYNNFVEVGHTKVLKGLMLEHKNISVKLAPQILNKRKYNEDSLSSPTLEYAVTS